MICPKCSKNTKTVDSRFCINGLGKRRRHSCKCGHKFTTLETIVEDCGQGVRIVMDRIQDAMVNAISIDVMQHLSEGSCSIENGGASIVVKEGAMRRVKRARMAVEVFP